MAKKYKYSFTRKKEGREGVLAIVLSVISFALFGILCLVSFAFEGQAGTAIGALGLFAVLIAGYGLVVAVMSLMKKDAGHRYAMIGSIASGVALILWLAVFFAGLK